MVNPNRKAPDLQEKLILHLRMLGLEASNIQQDAEKLIQYVNLIDKWNRVHNLTSIRKPVEMLTHHIVDSLVVLPHLIGNRLADVGSGAGLPGIPIAILKPNWTIVLIESNQKKAAFLQQVKFELALKNIKVVAGRAEAFEPDKKFNIVICRALCSLRNFILLTEQLRDDSSNTNQWVAMKSANFRDELNQLPDNYFVERIVSLTVPGVGVCRFLIFINKKEEK